jgi:hypothetical protein
MPGSYREIRWRGARLDDASLLSGLEVAVCQETYAELLPNTHLDALATHPELSSDCWQRLLRGGPDRRAWVLLAPNPVGYVW